MPKPTYSNIAVLAGVGTATVERVLNGRGGVRPGTVEKVLLAAHALDWPRRMPERHRGLMRIEVILVRPEASFSTRLATAFREIAFSLDPALQIHLTFLEEDDPTAIAERILNPTFHRSGIVVASPAYPDIAKALSAIHRTRFPIVQVVTRTIEEGTFVGIDNYAVGRMAALLVSKMSAVEGTIVALCHSQVYGVHRDRICGFSDYFSRNPRSGLRFEYVAFGWDERSASALRVADALDKWPDIIGIYNAGGANAGVIQELRRSKRKIFFVGHELTDLTRVALRDGTADIIFDQEPEAQARRAINLLLSQLGLLHEHVDNPPIRFTTITAENL